MQRLLEGLGLLDQVYDILAIRIITDSVKNCYAALGVIHNEWHPIPGRIKDFIAMPRPNLYQSLHTSVIGPGGVTFEVQIRTDDMHRIAEEGIAAHWKYKEGRKGPAADDQRIAWLRHLVEWQRDVQDPTEFMSTLKVDLYPEEVYTFTPRGKVLVLPRDGGDPFPCGRAGGRELQHVDTAVGVITRACDPAALGEIIEVPDDAARCSAEHVGDLLLVEPGLRVQQPHDSGERQREAVFVERPGERDPGVGTELGEHERDAASLRLRRPSARNTTRR